MTKPILPDNVLLRRQGTTTEDRTLDDVLGELTDDEFRARAVAQQTGAIANLKTMGDLRRHAGLPLYSDE